MDVLGLLEKYLEFSGGLFNHFSRIVGFEKRLVFHDFKAGEKKRLATFLGDSFDFLLGLLLAQRISEVFYGSLPSLSKNIIEQVSQKGA